MKNRNLFFLVVASMLFAFGCGSNEVQLTYNLEKGKNYYIKINLTQDLTQNFMQQQMNMGTQIGSEISYNVLEKTDDKYQLDLSYTSFNMDLSTPQGQMKFSSASPDTTDAMSQMLSVMTESNFQLEINNKGELLNISGMDAMFDNIINKTPAMSEMEKNQIRQSLNNIVGEESFKGNFGMTMVEFPDKPLKKGDTWETSRELKSMSLGNTTTEWKLVEIKGNSVMIEGNGYFESVNDSAMMAETGIPMQFDLEGPITFKLQVNKNTGWVMNGTINQDISGTVSMPGNEQFPEGMDMSMTINSTTEVTGGEK